MRIIQQTDNRNIISMRDRNTIEFLEIWETLFNPNFNPLEFEGIRRKSNNENH